MELLLLVSLICGGLLVALVHRPHRNPHIPPHDAALRDTLSEPVPASAPQDRPRQTVLHGSAYVVDGDTLVIRNTRIRLFGVDAPEMQHPFGQKAKWALVSLCKGKTVRAEVIEEDSHGRIVARCYLEDGRDLSAEMVRLRTCPRLAEILGRHLSRDGSAGHPQEALARRCASGRPDACLGAVRDPARGRIRD